MQLLHESLSDWLRRAVLPPYVTVDGGDFTSPFTSAVTSMSLHGYNMVMVYSFEKTAPDHTPTPTELKAFLDHCESVGMQVIFDFIPWWEKYSYCAANMTAGCDIAAAESAFEEMVAVGAASRSLIGYYICDVRHATLSISSCVHGRAATVSVWLNVSFCLGGGVAFWCCCMISQDCCSLSDDQTTAQSKHGYPKLKLLDRYHPTIGAVNCNDMASQRIFMPPILLPTGSLPI